MASKVYFTDLRTRPDSNLQQKLRKLLKQSGLEKIKFKSKFTALKIHFGEPGNLAYIRPNYAATVVSYIRDLGGIPFLTDSNTLYSGRRSNAIDHLRAAEENGFSWTTTGANVIIADGLRGTEFREIKINQKHCKTAKIGSAIADADIIISLTHFKGHELTGFGGALKNIGMGSGSRGGKLEMHSASKPAINKKNCISCGMCIKYCPQKAISFDKEKNATINYAKCIGCGQCIAVCQFNAAQVVWNENSDATGEKIAEYALAALKGKPNFHISFLMNVSPNCDCWPANDAPIVPDIGIAASFDPVALDCACVDMVNAAVKIPGTALTEANYEEGADAFSCIHTNTNWRACLKHAADIGIGKMEYNLSRLKLLKTVS
ncbi:MAG: DUF362 domain-containing protein [Smithellaceae bacterium]